MKDEQVGTTVLADEPGEEQGPTGPAAGDDRALEAELGCLRQLLEEEAVEEARRLVRELEHRWPNSDRVQYWAKVLAPPEVRVNPSWQARSLERERGWLQRHAGDYPGCWLAVFEDRLIAADPDLRTVIAAARRAIGDRSAVLHFEPSPAQVGGREPDVLR